MRTANFSIVVLTESNFTKQSALSTGRWVECCKILIEYTHFKKRVKKDLEKIQIFKSYEGYKMLVLTATLDLYWAAVICFDF